MYVFLYYIQLLLMTILFCKKVLLYHLIAILSSIYLAIKNRENQGAIQ